MNPVSTFAATFAFASLFAAASEARVYTLVGQEIVTDHGTATATGTITTNDALGALVATDILATDITISDGATTVNLTGEVKIKGTSLVASYNDLTFSYNGGEGEAHYRGLFKVIGSSLADSFCIGTGWSSCGQLDSDAIKINYVLFTNAVQLGRTEVIATVPEPSTWAMMLAGFAGLGGLAFRRRATAAVKA